MAMAASRGQICITWQLLEQGRGPRNSLLRRARKLHGEFALDGADAAAGPEFGQFGGKGWRCLSH